MSYIEELEKNFNDSFEKQTQEAFIKGLFDVYQMSHAECYKSYHLHEAHDLLPFLRWIKLRTLLRGMGDRFKEIEAISKPNGASSSYHILISTEKMILTVSTADSPISLPRPASHRIEYANQYQFNLEFSPEENIITNSKVYAILTHGAMYDDKRQPAFARVIFPAENYDSCIHRINLFDKHKDLVVALRESLTATQPERIAEITHREIAPQIIKKTI
jgi:hypothetical protein